MQFLIFLIVQFVVLGTIYTLAKEDYKSLVHQFGDLFQLSFIAPISLYIIDKTRLTDRLPKQFLSIYHKIVTLYGSKHGYIYSKFFIAQLISAFLIIMLFFSFLASINNDLVILNFGLFMAVIIPVFILKNLDKHIKKREEEILMELPELLNKIILLVNAGETATKAFIRSVKAKKNPENNFLYKELLISVHQLENNESFTRALEELNRRIGVQEVSIFTTTIQLNYRRGGDEFVTALRMLSKELWEKRKSLARTLGEKASSKLVFPMVFIFIVVMIVIAAPAILLF